MGGMATSVSRNPSPEGWSLGQFVPVRSESTAITVQPEDRILVLTGDTGRTFTLQTAARNTGRIIWFKNGCSADVDLTVDGAGDETIDGLATFVLDQHESVAIVSDGTNWLTLGRGGINGTAA